MSHRPLASVSLALVECNCVKLQVLCFEDKLERTFYVRARCTGCIGP